jgi:hypothetical protein
MRVGAEEGVRKMDPSRPSVLFFLNFCSLTLVLRKPPFGDRGLIYIRQRMLTNKLPRVFGPARKARRGRGDGHSCCSRGHKTFTDVVEGRTGGKRNFWLSLYIIVQPKDAGRPRKRACQVRIGLSHTPSHRPTRAWLRLLPMTQDRSSGDKTICVTCKRISSPLG